MRSSLTAQREDCRNCIPWEETALVITREDVISAIQDLTGEEPDPDLVDEVVDAIFPEIDVVAEVQRVLEESGDLR